MISNLPAVTLNWASPVNVDETANTGREVTTLLQSTADSWTSPDTNIQPDQETYPEYGFPLPATRVVRNHWPSPLSAPLAVSLRAKNSPGPRSPPPPTRHKRKRNPPLPYLLRGQSGNHRNRALSSSVQVISSTIPSLPFRRSLPNRYLNSLQFVQNRMVPGG